MLRTGSDYDVIFSWLTDSLLPLTNAPQVTSWFGRERESSSPFFTSSTPSGSRFLAPSLSAPVPQQTVPVLIIVKSRRIWSHWKIHRMADCTTKEKGVGAKRDWVPLGENSILSTNDFVRHDCTTYRPNHIGRAPNLPIWTDCHRVDPSANLL